MRLVGPASVALLASLAACGAPQTSTPPPNGGPTPTGPTAPAGDVTVDIPKVELRGGVYKPEALGLPLMPFAEPKRKTTLDKARQELAKAKEQEEKEARAQILATMLFRASRTEPADKAKALLEEARNGLRSSVTGATQTPDANTLRMLGAYEYLVGDVVGSAEAWGKLATAYPQDKEVDYFRTWWAYCLLQAGKNAEAAEVLKAVVPSVKAPELAYVTAWSRFRAGDNPGAWQAMRAATIGWPDKTRATELERDMILFGARTGAAVPEIQLVAKAFVGKEPSLQYQLLYGISQALTASGRYPDAVAMMDAALTAGGTMVAPQDPPKLRFQQSELTLRFDDPITGARFGKQAVSALDTCGAACTDRADVLAAVLRVATFFHSIFGTSHDQRYYSPARELYDAVLAASDATRKPEVQKLIEQIDKTRKAIRPGGGVHDKDLVAALLRLHDQEVLACYENVMVKQGGSFEGALSLVLEFDVSGAVTGATSTPPAGESEVAAVAKCSTERAKQWRLPARGKPGVSRVTMNYGLGLASPAAPAAPAAAQ